MSNMQKFPHELLDLPFGSLRSEAKDAQSAATFLEAQGVRFLLAQFTDVHGSLKSKSVPVRCLKNLLTEGAGFAGAAIAGFDMTVFDPEYLMVGELETLTLLPWTPGYARILGTGMVGGSAFALDPRNALKAQCARLAAHGWTANTGLEPEFYLLRRDESGALAPLDPADTLAKPAYDYRSLANIRPFVEQIVGSLQALGIGVYQIDHEDANGQYEVNFKYADALTSADNIQLFKMAASEIAHSLGGICSFMPKLSASTTGNGMHVHLSIADAEGKDLFRDDTDPKGMGLSPLAYKFMAGVLKHAKALTALLAPSVNSYKRLVVGTPDSPYWAPVYIAYGDNNRSAMVRIPYGRIEIRTGDGGMNVYLALAAIIAAGLDGIENNLDAGEPHNINFFTLSPSDVAALGVETLPQTLDQAIDCLEADKVLAHALGERLVNAFIKVKRQEWRDYHMNVSEWELKRYLTFF
jgi:glutamine synthetase